MDESDNTLPGDTRHVRAAKTDGTDERAGRAVRKSLQNHFGNPSKVDTRRTGHEVYTYRSNVCQKFVISIANDFSILDYASWGSINVNSYPVIRKDTTINHDVS